MRGRAACCCAHGGRCGRAASRSSGPRVAILPCAHVHTRLRAVALLHRIHCLCALYPLCSFTHDSACAHPLQPAYHQALRRVSVPFLYLFASLCVRPCFLPPAQTILTVDDFLMFKAMMVRRNIDLTNQVRVGQGRRGATAAKARGHWAGDTRQGHLLPGGYPHALLGVAVLQLAGAGVWEREGAVVAGNPLVPLPMGCRGPARSTKRPHCRAPTPPLLVSGTSVACRTLNPASHPFLCAHIGPGGGGGGAAAGGQGGGGVQARGQRRQPDRQGRRHSGRGGCSQRGGGWGVGWSVRRTCRHGEGSVGGLGRGRLGVLGCGVGKRLWDEQDAACWAAGMRRRHGVAVVA